MAKKKFKTKTPNDVKWCRENIANLTPRAYFDKFKFKNRRAGHNRYKIVTNAYMNKKWRKALQDEFDVWRSGVESQQYWLTKTRKATKASLQLGAAEKIESAIEDEFQLMDGVSSPLSSQEVIQEEEEEEAPEKEKVEEQDSQYEQESEDGSTSSVILPVLSTVDDDSFTSFTSTDKHPAAESYYNCLLGNGSRNWHTSDPSSSNCSDWILNDINITTILKKIRSSSMTAAGNWERISNIRILALSHIFPISPDCNESITSLMLPENDLLLASTKVMKRNPVPERAAKWANRIINKDSEDQLELHRLFLEMKNEALTCNESGDLIKHADYLEDMMKFYRLPLPNDTEDNLVDRLKLMLRHVFNDNQLVLNANTKRLESNDTYIPDYKVSCFGKCRKLFDLFIVEAKLSEKTYFPHQDDFIKLRLEMQSVLNSLIKANVCDPFSFGMIAKGLTCKVLMMWLKYDGQYICRQVGSFSLPNTYDEIVLCPGILTLMLTLKERIDQLVERIKNSGGGQSPLFNYMRTGFEVPTLVREPLTNNV